MTDWIDAEVKRLRDVSAESTRQAEINRNIQMQASEFWTDLRYLVKQSVEKINNTPDIAKQLGRLQLKDLNVHYFEIVKDVIPAVYLTVTQSYISLKVEKKIVTSNGVSDRNVDESRENLEYVGDAQGRIYVRTEEGKQLHLQAAAEYLIRQVFVYN